MKDLEKTIKALAMEFTEGLLRAVSQARPMDIVDEDIRRALPTAVRGSNGTRAAAGAARKPAQRPRPLATPAGGDSRSPDGGARGPVDGAHALNAVLGALKRAKGGLRSVDLQQALSVDKATISRAVSEGLATKKIRKTGHTRSTTYYANA